MVTKKATDAERDVEEARRSLARALRGALPSGTFAERERAALELMNEAIRQLLEQEPQSPTAAFGESVNNTERRRESKA